MKGSVAVLTVFLLGVLTVTWVFSSMLRSGISERVERSTLLQSAQTIQAVRRAVESEFNQYLTSVVNAAVYEVGSRGGEENELLQLILARARLLENAWRFPNVEVHIPVQEITKCFVWSGDGRPVLIGDLPATFQHVLGLCVWGLRLEVQQTPRFKRMLRLAELIRNLSLNENWLSELNENYRKEGFRFRIENGSLLIEDLWSSVLVKSG